MDSDQAAKKALFIIAQINFRDEEFFEPKTILQKAGLKIVTASISKENARSVQGKTVLIDVSINDARSADYSVVIFAGGSGAKVFFQNPAAHKIAREMMEAGKVIAAICISPTIIARAGLLKGKKATSFISEKESLEREGAVFTGAPVERDGKIITASGPEAARDFANAIIKALR